MCFGEKMNKLKNSDKATFYIPREVKAMPAPTSKRPARIRSRFRGIDAHDEQKKNLSSDELDTFRRSRTFTVVLTTNGEVHTHDKAQVFVHDLNLLVTVQQLKETPPLQASFAKTTDTPMSGSAVRSHD